MIGDVDALRSEHGDVAIGEEEHLARVSSRARDIAGDEKFIFAEADDRRRAESARRRFCCGSSREERPSA